MKIRKKVLFYTILVIGTYLSSELVVFTGYYIMNSEPFSWSQFQSERLALMESPATQNDHADGNGELRVGKNKKIGMVIHPYHGYVYDPGTFEGVSDYGFRGESATAPMSQKTDENIIVGIFGGSFAEGTSISARNVIVNQLKQLSQFHNKKFIVHTLALGGYKQPQHLLALTYFLALGTHFDIVINLDGFNEVALPAYENTPKQVNPFFPRNWYGRVHALHDPKMLILRGQISYLTERQKVWAGAFARTPIRYSIVANLLWKYYNDELATQQVQEEMAFNEYKIEHRKNIPYLVTGPSFHYENESELYKDLALVWRRSSEQMHGLCVANGIQYFHFLQPNQYVANSKIMKEKELNIAFREDEPYKRGVEQGYPYLIEEGRYLKTQGVRFYDLTMVFATNNEPLYLDTCCHLNRQGYQMIAKTIGKAIQKALE